MMSDDQRGAWLAERAGKLTASRMKHAMDFRKDGKPGAERSGYIRELLAERMTDHSIRRVVTDAMQHGIAYEDEAKIAYEAATGTLIDDPMTAAPLGIFNHPRITNFAASPDGMIGHDGLIEVKCPTPGKFIDWRLAGVVPEEHKPQMIAQLACTGRAWCEFVAYDPRIRDINMRLFVRRFTPDAVEIAAVESAAVTFLIEVESFWEQLQVAA